MKALTCEMCGSTNLIKEGGVFVCQSCGTKYSVEEAKKMMVEGTVDVKGTVKVDTSDELKNLYEIARRAKDSGNSENATRYYDMILVKDPSSWEANFYVVYYKAMSCRIADIASAGYSVINCLPSVIELVDKTIPEDEREKILKQIQLKCSSLAHMLSDAALSHFSGLDSSIKYNHMGDFGQNINSATYIVLTFGNILEERYNGKYGVLSIESWKEGFEVFQKYIKQIPSQLDTSGLQTLFNEYGDKIRKYEPSYITPSFSTKKTRMKRTITCTICGYTYNGDTVPNKCPICKAPASKFKETYTPDTNSSSTPSSGGCYVATAVYGSYDCPEVWTLRRFRDNTLAETWYGMSFIKMYYAISPTLVKWFGNTDWFKKMWKEPLDNMVKKLQSLGVESTPYKDRVW